MRIEPGLIKIAEPALFLLLHVFDGLSDDGLAD